MGDLQSPLSARSAAYSRRFWGSASGEEVGQLDIMPCLGERNPLLVSGDDIPPMGCPLFVRPQIVR